MSVVQTGLRIFSEKIWKFMTPIFLDVLKPLSLHSFPLHSFLCSVPYLSDLSGIHFSVAFLYYLGRLVIRKASSRFISSTARPRRYATSGEAFALRNL